MPIYNKQRKKAYFRVDLETGKVIHGEGDAVVIGCFQKSVRIEIMKNYQRVESVAQADGTRVFKNMRPEPMTVWSANRERCFQHFPYNSLWRSCPPLQLWRKLGRPFGADRASMAPANVEHVADDRRVESDRGSLG